jgi:hypothetical protein
MYLAASTVAYAALRGAQASRLFAVVALAAVVIAVFVSPWLTDHLSHWRDARFGGVKTLYKDPYPLKVNLVVYATFLEATSAALSWRPCAGRSSLVGCSSGQRSSRSCCCW